MCGNETFAAISSRMSKVCCPDDAEGDCSPVPATCDADCAHEFINFYSACSTTVAGFAPPVPRDMKSFKTKCEATVNATDATGGAGGGGGRRLQIDQDQDDDGGDGDASCLVDLTFEDDTASEDVCQDGLHPRWECLASERDTTMDTYRWLFILIIMLETAIVLLSYKLREAVANGVHQGAMGLWAGGGAGPTIQGRLRKSNDNGPHSGQGGLEMATFSAGGGGSAASAAEFYANQTKQFGAPADRLKLDPTHPSTGKRQMQAATAPNSIARVRCIFERFAVDGSDGVKTLPEDAFAKYTIEVGAVRPVAGSSEVPATDLAKRYKLVVSQHIGLLSIGLCNVHDPR